MYVFPQLRPFFSTCSSSEAETTVAPWRVAARLALSPRIQIDLATVQTNIVIFHLPAGAPDADTVVAHARAKGVLVIAFGPRTVRAVTHMDVSREQCEQGAEVLASIVESA